MIKSLREEGLLKGTVAELVLVNYLEESGSIGTVGANAATSTIVSRLNGDEPLGYNTLWDSP
jgi:hypothetical protein